MLEAIDRHDHAALARGARRLPVRSGVPRADRSRGRPLHHRRLAASDRRQARAAASARVRARRRRGRRSTSAGQVRVRWEEIKAQERGSAAKTRARRCSAASPPTLPALLRAYHIGVRAASVGFDWTARRRRRRQDPGGGATSCARSSTRAAPSIRRARRRRWAICCSRSRTSSRKLGIEPETALRKANDKFTRRFGVLEQHVALAGRVMRDMSLEELEAEWQRAKIADHAG